MQVSDYIFCPFCTGSRLETKNEEENKVRSYCPKCNWIHYPTPAIAVAAVITKVTENLEPRVLMVRRNREPFKGTWMFPAGFLEFGEHPEMTLAREVREETGLIVIRSRFLKIETAIVDPRSPNHLVVFYWTKADGTIANNDSDENSAIGWKSIYKPIHIGFPHHQTVFDDIKSNPSEYFFSYF